jgi:hypothetical protein
VRGDAGNPTKREEQYHARRHDTRLSRLSDVTLDKARKRAEQIWSQVSFGGDSGAKRARLRAVRTVADFCRDRYGPYI